MKTVLITGAGRGIGAACARAFADGGWRVALHCNASLPQAIALGERLGGPVLQADLSQPEQVDAMVDAALRRWATWTPWCATRGYPISACSRR